MRRISIREVYGDIETETIKEALLGRVTTAVRFSEDTLILEFGDEYVSLGVEGDCCSSSYFYDFYGVEKIIGKKIMDFKEIELGPVGSTVQYNPEDDDYLQAYGYKIVCEPNDDALGTSNTAVFSFRNSSNGFYGGNITNGKDYTESVPKIEKDTIL